MNDSEQGRTGNRIPYGLFAYCNIWYKIIILGCRRAAELLTGHNNATGKYEEGIVIFDQIEKQALEMADVMINGIIKQFPNIFR